MRTFTQKLAFLLVTLLCCAGMQVKASELTVAENATGSSSKLPAYGMYADTQGARSQCLYPADLLSDMSGGTISKLTFYLSSPADAAWTGTFTLSLKETDATSLDAFEETDLTAVYTGSMDATGTTLEVEFTDTYTYSGGNLIIDWYVTSAGNWKSASFTALASDGAGRARTSGSGAGSAENYLPKVTFEYTPGAGGGPSCDRVESVVVTDIAPRQATINWTGGSGSYSIEYKVAGADRSESITGLTGNSYVLSTLEPATSYSVSVYNVCGAENVSKARTASFTTSCDVLSSFPWSENFDARNTGNIAIPCWENAHIAGSGSSLFTIATGTGSNSTKVGQLPDMSSGTLTLLSLPEMNLPVSAIGYEFDIDVYRNSSYSGKTNEGLRVYISASSQLEDTVLLAFIPRVRTLSDEEHGVNAEEEDGWYSYEFPLPVESGPCRIFILGVSEYGAATSFDNIKVKALPTCFKPTELLEIDGKATKSSVQLDWTANTGETAWKLQYKKVSDSEWNTVDVTSKPYTLSGLETYTEYNVQVAANCGGGDISDYSKAITVKTATGVPFAESFNHYSLPSDWKRYTGVLEDVQNGEELESVSAGWTYGARTNGVFPDSTYHLYLNIGGTDTKHWIVSPIIEMEEGYQISFNLALTARTSSPTAVTAGQQADDVFAVVYTDGEGWTELRKWTNGGTEPVYDNINATADGQVVKIDIPASLAGKSIQIAFYGESTLEGGNNNLHISNFKIDVPPACEPATQLNITGISGTTATAVWDNIEDAVWQYCLQANPAADFEPTEFVTLNAGVYTVTLEGLDENTEYGFYLRRQCGEEDFSEIISRTFKTIQTPVVLDSEHSFSDNFESGNKWVLINGEQTNQWVNGTAASNGGSHALYISNDAGVNNAYSLDAYCYAYATKTFDFAETGVYTFSYDWRNNGGSSANLRAYLAPIDADPQAGASPSTGSWIQMSSSYLLYGQSDWQHESFDYTVEETGTYKVIFWWYNSSYGTPSNPAAAIDNFSISRMACPKPTGLAVAELGAENAKIEWNAAADAVAFEYAYAPQEDDMPAEFTSVVENSVVLSGLTPQTTYKFYLRKACSETEKSDIITLYFTTTQLPVIVGNSFVDDFEGVNGWIFTNGSATNAWVIGEAAHYGEGSANALYISKDGGTTHAYNMSSTSVVFATKTFMLEDANYIFKYDWISNGEYYSGAPCDYMRVVLVPGAPTLTVGELPQYFGPSALPSGWIALDGGAHQGSNAWQNRMTAEMPLSEGLYTVLLVWNNDHSSGADVPGAIDNFAITKVLCKTPTGLKAVADSATVSSALLTWTAGGAEENWLVRYRKNGTEAWSEPIAVAHVAGNAADSVKIEGLDASSTYEAQVAALCDPTDLETLSEYSASINFTTACGVISSLNENFDAVASGTGNVLPLCWSYINTSTSSSYNYYPRVYNSSYSANSGINCLQFYSYYSSSTDYDPRDQYAILPEFTSVSDKRIKLNARAYSTGSSYDATFIVGVMTDKADASTFVAIDTLCPASTTYEPFLVALNSYTGEGKYIAFKIQAAYSTTASYCYRALYIDDVVVEDLPSCLEVSGLAAELTQGNGTIATLSWNAGDASAWVVEYGLNADFSEAVSAEVAGEATLALTELTAEATYYARVKAVCGEGNESVWSDAISFIPTNAFSILVNDGTGTSSYVPMYTMYTDDNTNSQFIIPAASLASIQWGTINELTFYNASEETIDFGTAKFEVYMAEAPAASFASAAYVNWTSLTKVMNAATVSVAGSRMVITLDNPYLYEGGNLLIGFKLTSTGAYKTSSWYGVSISNSNSAVYNYSTYSVSRSDFLPKMKIGYTPGEAPACVKPATLSVVADALSTSSAVLTWTPQGTESNWLVRYRKVGEEAWSEPIHAAHVEGNEADSVTIDGLSPATTYEAQIAAWCDTEDAEAVSEYTASVQFVTSCGTISAFPYSENFDGISSGIPVCWDNAEGTTTNSDYKWTSYASGHEGRGLRFNSYNNSNGNTNFLKTPALAISKAAALSFYYKNPTGGDFSVFYSVDGGAQTALLSGLTGVSEWTLKEQNLPEECIGHEVVIIFKGTSNYGNGDAYIYLDDVMVEELSDCLKPTGAIVVSDVTSEGASFSWTNEEETAWKYAIAPASEAEPAEDAYISVAVNSVAIESGLADNTDYIFYLRRDCGTGLSSAIKAAFHTLQLSVEVGSGYSDDFEDGNNWLPLSAGGNAWVLGSATSNGGEHALYVSNDNGATNSYSKSGPSIVYATKSFHFDQGSYVFQYDWKAKGEGSSTRYDFLRVALVPVSEALVAGVIPTGFAGATLPSGYIALDNGNALNMVDAWQTVTTSELNVAEGDYMVVFAWKWDISGGTDPAAAIDNFSIRKILCSQPTAVTISDLTATSAAIGWTAPAEQSAWQIVCSTDADVVPADATPIEVTSNPYIISELTPETNYYVYVRANCGDDQFSNWSARGSFRTVSTCQTPNGVKVDSLSASSALISWNTYGQSDFNLRYKAAADADWTILNNAVSPQRIESLEGNTSYQVQVQAACEAETSWSTLFTFKTPCNAWSIVEDGNYVESFETYTGAAYNSTAGVAPDCWSVAAENFNNVKPHVIGSGSYSYTHSGTKALTFYGAGHCYAALPQFVEALSGLQISFWMQTETAAIGNMVLGYITAEDEGDFATFQPIDSLPNSYNAMTNYEIPLNGVPAEAHRLVFCWYCSGQYTCCIDDIEVTPIPSCLKPRALAVSEVTARTAKVEWEAGAEDQTAWQIALDTVIGFNPDTLSNLIDVTENPYVLTGLNPATRYNVYVRANCDVDDKSKWSNLASFTTALACPAPTALTATLTPGNGSIATLRWSAGAEENAWVVEYSLNADFSDAEVVEATDSIVNLTGLTAETTYYARVKADCGEQDGESVYSPAISFTPTDRYELLVNDGAATNGYVPVYGNWADNYSLGQFIVPAEQLEEIVWDSIKSLTFFASIDSHDFGAAQFKAYVAEPEESVFASAALYDWAELHEVMAAASLSVADGKMVVTFDEPYQYEGGNLLIGIEQTVPGTYKNFDWYGVTANGASVGGYKSKTSLSLTIAQRNFLPKMLIEYAPGVEPACKKPTDLVVSDIAAFSATVAWDEVEGANWEYAILPASEPAPASFELSTSDHSVALEGLSESTEYVFYLRRACGEGNNSVVVSIAFATDIQKAAIPFYENFESANSGWKLVNGEQANAWMIGEGAASTGSKALYISSNGSDNTYNKDVQSSTFAYILLDFDKAGTYHISYEWKANGDYDGEEIYDYLRVALVPVAEAIEAGGDLPTGAIALDGGQELYGAEGWHDFSIDLENVNAGLYKLVFAWFNDEQEGEDTPAAIDNIAVVYTSYPTGISNGAGIENQAVKFIHNDHVYILLNGNVYTVTGQKVELR